jgi:hypothetical protein
VNIRDVRSLRSPGVDRTDTMDKDRNLRRDRHAEVVVALRPGDERYLELGCLPPSPERDRPRDRAG